MDKLPMLSVDLIEELDKLFPERTPSRNTTIEEVMYNAGQRDLIRMLKALLKDTNDNLMDSLG